MYFSHLLESDFALTTGKHTQMTKENSKGMKVLVLQTHVKSRLKEALIMDTRYSFIRRSRSETITMPMICSLIEHGFLPVFSIERKSSVIF